LSAAIKPFSAILGGATAISPYTVKLERRLSDLREFFLDRSFVEQMLARGDNPLIYEVYEIPQKPVEGMFNVGCTVICPGVISGEYYLTMGHYHQKETTSEVYVGMEGEGVILMQDREGRTDSLAIKPKVLAYIPPNIAHRTVNTGRRKLSFLAIYPSDAGHDYNTMRTKGFAKLIVERNGKPTIVDNPRFTMQ